MSDKPTPTAPAIIAPRTNRMPQTVGELFRREEETTRRLSAVATRHLSAERAAHLAIMAVRKTPDLAKCTPVSFMGALMGATLLGLEPNTPKEQAYLIPYRRRVARRENGRTIRDGDGKMIFDQFYECQLQVGYRGFTSLFYRSPVVLSVMAETVYRADDFRHEIGTRTLLSFTKSLDERRVLPIPESDPFGMSPGMVGAFCFLQLERGGQAFSVVPLEDILKSRSRSQAWQQARGNIERSVDGKPWEIDRARREYAETPWVAWEQQMASKTAIRVRAKTADLGEEQPAQQISLAADLDALNDAGILDNVALTGDDSELASEVAKGNAPLPIQEHTDDDAGGDSPGDQEQQAADPAGEQRQNSEPRDEQAEPAPDQRGTVTEQQSKPRMLF